MKKEIKKDKLINEKEKRILKDMSINTFKVMKEMLTIIKAMVIIMKNLVNLLVGTVKLGTISVKDNSKNKKKKMRE